MSTPKYRYMGLVSSSSIKYTFIALLDVVPFTGNWGSHATTKKRSTTFIGISIEKMSNIDVLY